MQLDLQRLRGAALRLMKRYLRLPKIRGETDAGYHTRACRVIRSDMLAGKICRLDVLALKRQHMMAGHLARLCHDSPHMLVSKVLAHETLQLQHTRRALGGTLGHTHQYHAKSAWEHEFFGYYEIMGTYWMDYARNRTEWRHSFEGWAKWRLGVHWRSDLYLGPCGGT